MLGSQGHFLCLLVLVKGKAVELSVFDRGELNLSLIIARLLATSTLETVRLVGCLQHIFVGIFAKCMKGGVTISLDYGIGCPHVIKKKRRPRRSCLVKQNR